MAVGNTEAEPLSMVLAPWNAAKAPSLCLGQAPHLPNRDPCLYFYVSPC